MADLATYIDQKFGEPDDETLRKAYYNWKTNEQKTVKTLCNLIVQRYRDCEPKISVLSSSTYAIAWEYADKEQYGEMTDDEKYYTETRGGIWKYDKQRWVSDKEHYIATHPAPNPNDEGGMEMLQLYISEMPQLQDYVYDFRGVMEKCKEFMKDL